MGVAATLAPKGFGPQDSTKKNWPIGWTFWVNHHLKKLFFNNLKLAPPLYYLILYKSATDVMSVSFRTARTLKV